MVPSPTSFTTPAAAARTTSDSTKNGLAAAKLTGPADGRGHGHPARPVPDPRVGEQDVVGQQGEGQGGQGQRQSGQAEGGDGHQHAESGGQEPAGHHAEHDRAARSGWPAARP